MYLRSRKPQQSSLHGPLPVLRMGNYDLVTHTATLSPVDAKQLAPFLGRPAFPHELRVLPDHPSQCILRTKAFGRFYGAPYWEDAAVRSPSTTAELQTLQPVDSDRADVIVDMANLVRNTLVYLFPGAFCGRAVVALQGFENLSNLRVTLCGSHGVVPDPLRAIVLQVALEAAMRAEGL
ncbi:hypothetical protein BOTBODRAFT_192285 [Botryobasidium botryosum FD-172 SS1]|uniref:Uncharacterized protein n=1 Tax=Botryobasidium botryosum (strain FD-172 SS1) TaxID=930990 RepID=A0A067LWB0_BOTB1|nr:hypothetical protein BOTBODRAFT_192285 [Botryobasidium botryosum FD-172 SS1]